MFDFSNISPALNFSAEGMYVKDAAVIAGTDPGNYLPVLTITLPTAATTKTPSGSATLLWNFTLTGSATVKCADETGAPVVPPSVAFSAGNHSITCNATNSVGKTVSTAALISIGEVPGAGAGPAGLCRMRVWAGYWLITTFKAKVPGSSLHHLPLVASPAHLQPSSLLMWCPMRAACPLPLLCSRYLRLGPAPAPQHHRHHGQHDP
jgi:hypothetical protein